jgi:hypothetical protein
MNLSRLIPVAAVTALAGCGSLLEVDVPSRVLSEFLDDPRQAPLLVTSVQATFECAYGAYVLTTGLVSDELENAQGSASNYGYDRRSFDPGEGLFSTYARSDCFGSGTPGIGVYTPLSSARWFADRTTERLEQWTDAEVTNRQSRIATTAAYAGYALVLMGEGFCSAAIDGGPELTKAQLFAEAETRFSKAITAAQTAGNTNVLNLARVGRARARINQARNAEALADAQQVPATFVYNMTADTDPLQRENRVFDWVNFRPGASVDEPFRDVQWQGVPDPRVAVANTGIRHGPLNELRYEQRKYTARNTPIPVASGDEARLIIAEIAGGQTAVDIINDLHTAVGIPAGFSSTDPAVIRQQVIEERRRELFLQGHRLWDQVRFSLPLYPATGAVFSYGGFYGSETCFPIPNRERDGNPNF